MCFPLGWVAGAWLLDDPENNGSPWGAARATRRTETWMFLVIGSIREGRRFLASGFGQGLPVSWETKGQGWVVQGS